jgi:hypothetical protein
MRYGDRREEMGMRDEIVGSKPFLNPHPLPAVRAVIYWTLTGRRGIVKKGGVLWRK